MTSGVFREIYELAIRKTEDALNDAGYVMTFEGATTAGNVKKTESTGTYLTPCGINYQSTEDRKYKEMGGTQYLSDVNIALIREGEVYVKLPATHSAIAVGDILIAADDGRCTGTTGLDTTSAATLLADMEKVVGIALEAKAADAGGKVLVKLELRRGV